MTKRLLSLLLTLCLCLCAGCSQQPETTAPSAQSQPQQQSLDLQALYLQMSAKLPDMLTVDGTMMLDLYGIRESDCLQAVVAVCSTNLQTDEVWLLEARDPEALARLQTLARARLDVKESETENYLPDQYVIVKDARLIAHDNYLVMLVSAQADALESLFREAID